jgi:hypothetical protein
VDRIAALLGEQAAAIRALSDVVKRDARDVAILEQESKGAAPGAVPGW